MLAPEVPGVVFPVATVQALCRHAARCRAPLSVDKDTPTCPLSLPHSLTPHLPPRSRNPNPKSSRWHPPPSPWLPSTPATPAQAKAAVSSTSPSSFFGWEESGLEAAHRPRCLLPLWQRSSPSSSIAAVTAPLRPRHRHHHTPGETALLRDISAPLLPS